MIWVQILRDGGGHLELALPRDICEPSWKFADLICSKLEGELCRRFVV